MESNKNGMVETVMGQNLGVETVNVTPKATQSKLKFKARVIKHLEGYKTDIIKISEKGLYHHKGKELHYAHMISFQKDKSDYNLLEKYRSSYIVYRSIKRIIPPQIFPPSQFVKGHVYQLLLSADEKKRLGAILIISLQ